MNKSELVASIAEQSGLKKTEAEKAVKAFIDTVTEPLPRKILRYRYLKCYTWGEISELLGYDARSCCRFEAEAITDL